MEQWAGIILAAGSGQRMKSRRPKPLHRVCGKELIRHPVELLQGLGLQSILVVVSPANAEAVRSLLGNTVDYVIQPTARGTGDAASQAVAALRGQAEHLIVLGSDSPLIRVESVRQLTARHLAQGNVMTMLTASGIYAQDLGRIVRDDDGQIAGLVEASDWEGEEWAPAEVNGGVYCFDLSWLTNNLEKIHPSSNGEKYLTSLVAIGAAQGDQIDALPSEEPEEIFGVNDRVQLAQVEAIRNWQICEQWLRAGVTIQDPASVYIDAGVSIGQDTIIRPNTMLLGRSTIGEDCVIGPNSVLQDSRVGDRCRIIASMLEEAVLEDDVAVGPFSHLRPAAHLERGVHLGNFVEVKESRLGPGAVAGHFSYLGDASIGANVNIGAGTVTCNYDGQDKHRTVIGEGAFIGCDTMLVAPVTVGADAATGAGSVVTKDVPQGLLAVGIPARIRPRKHGQTKLLPTD